MRRIAVITGGGSFGAYHVGTLCRLLGKYDIVYGTSTGALMAPFVALGEYRKLKEAYTNIGQLDVFNNRMSNPVKSNGKISLIKAAFRILRGKKSLGATDKALKKSIDRFYTSDLHNRLVGLKNCFVNCVDLRSSTPSRVNYFNSKTNNHRDFKEYMRASASFPLLMSPVYKNNMELVDGGVSETASLAKAMALRPDEIDVFVHTTKPKSYRKERVKNIMHLAMRVIYTFMDEVRQNDLEESKIRELAKKYGVKKVNLYYMHKEYTNRMVFNKKEMSQMFSDGFNNLNVCRLTT